MENILMSRRTISMLTGNNYSAQTLFPIITL